MSALGDRGARGIAGEDWDGLDMATPGPVDVAAEDSLFPPIGEYGFLSDCETTALIAPSGNVEWLCLPRIDSPSVLGAILDRSAGGFRLGPEGITAGTCPGRWCWRRAGPPRPDGWWCATS